MGPLVDPPDYTRPTQILTRSEKERKDAKYPAGIRLRSQPDCGATESRSGLNCNGTVEFHEDHTEREDDGARDPRSMKESSAVTSISNTPRRLSEGVERRKTDLLQRPAINQSDEIEAEDSEEQG